MTSFNFTKYKRNFIFLGFLFFIISCSSGGGSTPVEPKEIIPSNLSLTVTIVGKDANNPNGDGSGKIQCSATATNANSYGYIIGDNSEIASTNGNLDYTFTDVGTNSHIIKVIAYSSTGNSISTSKTINVSSVPFSTLIFSDEFNTDGSPDSSKWNYDIGTGNNGWGNGESQYYTNRSDNVIISGGVLKITAKKESYQGSHYTSTRMLTQGKFNFTYGRVEVRAKLPSGGGTWPAIWMLGSNISTVGWPACGEIDIMEHIGNNQGTVQSAMHTPSSFGGTVNKGSQFIADVSTNFHIYVLEWTSEKMVFSVDGVKHYTYNPSMKNSSTWPFNQSQFILLNVAMGGSFGGAIDTNFTSSTMEIDYVRVYQ